MLFPCFSGKAGWKSCETVSNGRNLVQHFVHLAIGLVPVMCHGLQVQGALITKRVIEALSTRVTGFLFPFTVVTPAIKLGIFSLLVLTLAIVTRYFLQPVGMANVPRAAADSFK